MAFRKTIWRTYVLSNCSLTTLPHKHSKSILTKRSENYFSLRRVSKKLNGKSGQPDARPTESYQRFASFEEMVEVRRSEARRSIIVQVHSEQSCRELYSYCSQYGPVKSMHHYTLSGPSHYVLVEFNEEENVDSVLHNTGRLDTNQVVPVWSPFLWFRIDREKLKVGNISSKIPPIETDGNNTPSEADVYRWIHEAESVSDQILILSEATRLSNLGSRLRFLTALQIEQALTGPFRRIKACPFGSSVNGFGKMNCDLDLVLELDREEANPDCRLIFHAKNSLTNGRTQVQRHMETIGDICQLFLPGCSNVRRILHARVPIVKYRQKLTGVECDISMTNMSAVYMSELLFVLNAVDERVRPLVQAVRAWARDIGLTNPAPGRWITNFSLTLLVLFYLQQALPHPVLPTLNQMVSMATTADRRITAEGINCTFTRDLNKLMMYMDTQHKNTNTLEELLQKFFGFYCSFDFSSHAISLATGHAIPKPEHTALYIVNPLERGLNVSKNVSPEEVERLRIEFRNAAWTLEANIKRHADETALWGLTAIFQAPKLQAKGKNIFYIPPKVSQKVRRFSVTDLFCDDLELKEVTGKPTEAMNVSVPSSKMLQSTNKVQEIHGNVSVSVIDKKTVHSARRRKR